MAWMKSALQFIIISCIIQLSWGDYNINPEWEYPDAFSQRKTVSSGKKLDPSEECTCNCQTPGNSKDDHVPSLYRKLVKFLLKRDSLKFDESSKIFYRSLHLYVDEKQMERFDKMTDPHDMDQLISEVLYQSRSGAFELFQEIYLTWRDTFILYWNVVLSSRQVVIAIQFAGFLLTWFASRKFKFRFSVVGLSFALYYLYSFLDAECHRKKEIERAAQMFGMKYENPCNTTSFWSYYFRNQNDDCKKFLENSYDSPCTLIDISEEFVNVFFYKQIWNFIDNSVANIIKVYASYGIVGALVVSTICIYLFNNYVQLTIKLIWQYISSPSSRPASGIRQQNVNGAGDTITSEVLNKILDIAKDQTQLNAMHLARLGLNSGVQQIDVVDGNDSSDNKKFNIVTDEPIKKIIVQESVEIIT